MVGAERATHRDSLKASHRRVRGAQQLGELAHRGGARGGREGRPRRLRGLCGGDGGVGVGDAGFVDCGGGFFL